MSTLFDIIGQNQDIFLTNLAGTQKISYKYIYFYKYIEVYGIHNNQGASYSRKWYYD